MNISRSKFASRRAQLRPVTRHEAAISRHLRHELRMPVHVAGQPWVVSLQRFAQRPVEAREFLVALDDTTHRVAITCASLQRVLAEWLGPVAVETVEETLVLAMLHDVAAGLSHELGRVLSCQSDSGPEVPFIPSELLLDRSDGGNTARPAGDTGSWLLVTLKPRQGAAASLWLASQHVDYCAMHDWWRPVATHVAAVERLPAIARIEHGWVTLSQRELSTLRCGDAITGSTLHGCAPGSLLVLRLANSLGIHCISQTDGSAIATSPITVIHEQDHFPAAEGESLEAAPAIASSLSDAVPISLTFDLGSHALPLAELRGIDRGHVFELGLRPEAAVTIRANGVRIGAGELVDIDGRIGVAFTRIELANS